MDILTTNWTEKIKTNPVANCVLNSNRYDFARVRYNRPLQRASQIQRNRDGDGIEHINSFGGAEKRMRVDHIKDFLNGKLSESQAIAKGHAEIAAHDARRWGWDFRFYDEPDQYEADVEVPDYWANTYVKDYINISHPKIRPCYVSAMSSQPLQIKPPSVFFSDV
jgi:hypothetical protein